MPITTIEELWQEFWAWTEGHAAGAYLFRGQADSSPILPKIGRSTYGFDPSREKALFDAFERAARPFLTDGSESVNVSTLCLNAL